MKKGLPILAVLAIVVATPFLLRPAGETSDWRPGTYHWTDGGQCSWYDFAVAIHDEALDLGLLDKAVAIRPIPSTEYPVPAARPSYSVLDCTSTMAEFDVAQTPWRDNLRSMLEEMS